MLGALPVLLLLAFLVVEAGRAIVAVRRSRRINRAMHELRRPLQTLSLILEREPSDAAAGKACMEQARAALAELDAVINRAARREPGRRRGELSEVISAIGARWRAVGVEVAPDDADGIVLEPERLNAAIDNLVANALEHGRAPVSVRAERQSDAVRLVVTDAGPDRASRHSRRDPRRGHGLKIVEENVARCGGGADLTVTEGGTQAAVTIPVWPSGAPRSQSRPNSALR